MKPNPFQNKTAGRSGSPEAKRHFKRYQPLPMLDFPRPAREDKAPGPTAPSPFSTQTAAAQAHASIQKPTNNIMKTKMLITLCLSLLTGVIQAAPLTVAVYDFKGDAEAATYGNNVTTLVTADLTTETNLVMLERSDLNKVLNEQSFGFSGMVNADAAAKIGQITGVKVLIAGQVIRTGNNRLVIVANIIGTETARLFAAKVEGAADNLLALTDDLSRKIARTICEQATNLVAPPVESRDERVARIIKSIEGTNRPSVLVNINAYNEHGDQWRENISSGELGAVLLKAGFKVMNDNSEQKPDILITGLASGGAGPAHGGLFSSGGFIEVTVQDRRSGRIVSYDHQGDTVTDVAQALAGAACSVKIADELAERILPLLAK